jgi:hypothetical protein
MNDPALQTNWFTYLIGGFVALLTAVFEYYRRRVDRIDEHYVSKEMLQKYIDDSRHERVEMHRQNIDSLKEIRGSVERVHERIDVLYK